MAYQKHKVLLVDDDQELRKMLCIFLDFEDFEVIECETGEQALRTIGTVQPDLVLLDLGLADIDGKKLIATLREDSQVPIVVLTARTEDEEAVVALNLGADDYITKPFHANVLLARINANIRSERKMPPDTDSLSNGPIRIDLTRHEVFIRDALVPFSPKEFALLHLFVRHKGQSMPHRDILRKVWGPTHTSDTQYLRVYIGQIRNKLETCGGLGHAIVSEPGAYRMDSLWEEPWLSDSNDQVSTVAATNHCARS